MSKAIVAFGWGGVGFGFWGFGFWGFGVWGLGSCLSREEPDPSSTVARLELRKLRVAGALLRSATGLSQSSSMSAGARAPVGIAPIATRVGPAGCCFSSGNVFQSKDGGGSMLLRGDTCKF